MTEKIPADEYARRHDWPTSAVVHRIKAGIYDGVEESGTWYVLRDSPSAEGPVPLPSQSKPERRLPWETVPGPFAWTTWVLRVAAAASVGVLFFADDPGRYLWVVGLSASAVGSSITYEGLRTGTVRNKQFRMSFRDNPIQFWVLIVTFASFVVLGLAMVWISAAR